jgi:YebC/PmpR family DNA-binding regulatory protein
MVGVKQREIQVSGHSKWATIKHKKAAKDAKRGASFTKFANLISVAARGGADPETNFRLRLAIDSAKKAGVPGGNIDRAIARGAGSAGSTAMEEVLYEGYGPGGVAVMVATATDNRNRTAAEVRSAFTKMGGSLGTSGSVAYQFDQKGVIGVETNDTDAATLDAIEAGAEDIDEEGSAITVYTAPTQLDAVRKKLQEAGYQIDSAQLSFIPKQQQMLDTETATKVIRLMDNLDELDDVTDTYTNADFPPDFES